MIEILAKSLTGIPAIVTYGAGGMVEAFGMPKIAPSVSVSILESEGAYSSLSIRNTGEESVLITPTKGGEVMDSLVADYQLDAGKTVTLRWRAGVEFPTIGGLELI